MLFLDGLDSYIRNLKDCDSVTAKVSIGDCHAVVETTEVYQFEGEGALDRRLDEVKSHPGFTGCRKKWVPAKEKKGEVIRDEYWQLTVTIKHDI